ncbi:MAG: phosphoribosyltransferase family protein [bacterium]|nr:phosphoribosyltransferase family protein [bacterium]
MFENREDAGKKLAYELKKYKGQKVMAVALPRGGVVVGKEIAKSLKIPLEVFIVHKLGSLYNPEFGFGAIAEGGEIFIDQASIQSQRLTFGDLQRIINEASEEVRRRVELYRKGEKAPSVFGKTVILIDDGLATGVTAQVAISALRKQKPKEIILAVPVCSLQSADLIRSKVDDLICLISSAKLHAVGAWYKDFKSVSDEKVIGLLRNNGYPDSN